jgi:hypothetical protein
MAGNAPITANASHPFGLGDNDWHVDVLVDAPDSLATWTKHRGRQHSPTFGTERTTIPAGFNNESFCVSVVIA